MAKQGFLWHRSNVPVLLVYDGYIHVAYYVDPSYMFRYVYLTCNQTPVARIKTHGHDLLIDIPPPYRFLMAVYVF